MLGILATSLLAVSPSAPQITHSTAQVTDSLSHGTLGDGLLSLDEAIRLVNGTLLPSQLSPAEAANLSGAGVVDHVRIDPTITLSIALEAPLTPITGQGGEVWIEGVIVPFAGGDVLTLLLGGAHAHVLSLQTHEVLVSGLHLDGGVIGFDVHTTAAGVDEHQMARIEDCDLHGQLSAGVRLTGSGTDTSAVHLHHAHFHNMARGILLDDQSAGGWAQVHVHHAHMDQVTLAAEVQEAGTGGAMSMFMCFRSEIDGGTNFLRVRRTAGSSQQLMVRVVHCEVVTSGDTIDVQGNANGLTMIHHHHSHLTCDPGSKAMLVGPRTAMFDFHGSEVTFTGDVSVAANLFTQRVWQQNNEYVNSTVTFDVASSLPNLLWNRYDNCAIVVPSTASTPVRLRSCELVNTTVTGQSLLAPVTLENSWRSGGSLNGQVNETGAAPGRFLSVCEVAPTEVQIGSTFDLITDAPPNVAVFWVATVAIEQPNTAQEPFRFYGDPATAQTLLFAQGQSTLTLAVPNDPVFTGFEFYLAPVAFSALGYGPDLHLPRGGRLQPIL
ncbi:MAG: hypothetical protein AB7O97_11245 [Planctomycetota bacterium]